MLNHPHRAYDELLTVDHVQFDSYKAAYLHREQHHEHEDDHYGDIENLDPDADPEEWVTTLPWTIGCSRCLRPPIYRY
jgi:ATP-dependent DNA helicase PIF1